MILLGVTATVATSAAAEAQAWLEDRDTVQGPGFSLGNFRLHPGVAAEAGYDSNLFRQNDNAQGSAIFRLTAHLFLESARPSATPDGVEDSTGEGVSGGRRRVYLRVGGAASYNIFLENRAQNNVGVNGDFALTFNPDGRFQATLLNNYNRSVRPFVDATSADDAPSYVRNRNESEFRLQFASPGRVFQGGIGYRFRLDFFEDAFFDYANSFTHQPYLDFAYRFLPRTAVISEVRVSYRSYLDPAGAPTALPNALVLDARAGLNGALSRTVSFAVTAGYSAGFFDSFSDFDGGNARVELRWKPRPSIALATGYERSFSPSFIGNFVERDQVYVQGRVTALGRLLAQSRLSVAFEETGAALSGDGGALGSQAQREDIRVSWSNFLEYRFVDWLAVNLTFAVNVDSTDFEFVDPSPDVLFPDPAGGFVSVEVFGGVRAFF
ncbi:MAG: hypothetical protein AAF447_04420 [Myxococcota bacterium]